MYCLTGPEEKIFQVTFARKKHQILLEQLQALNTELRLRTVPQREFIFSTIFGDYFSGRLRTFDLDTRDLPMVAAGTEFQQMVWERMRAIPYGSGCRWTSSWAPPRRPWRFY